MIQEAVIGNLVGRLVDVGGAESLRKLSMMATPRCMSLKSSSLPSKKSVLIFKKKYAKNLIIHQREAFHKLSFTKCPSKFNWHNA